MRVLYLAVCASALQAPVRRRRLTRRQIAPSGVDGLPVPLQAVVFLAARAAGGGAVARSGPVARSATQNRRRRRGPRTQGNAFLARLPTPPRASATCRCRRLRAITPPLGTWGLWPVPTAPAPTLGRQRNRPAARPWGGAAALAVLELEAPASSSSRRAAVTDYRGHAGEHPRDTHGATMGTPPLPRPRSACGRVSCWGSSRRSRSHFSRWGDGSNNC